MFVLRERSSGRYICSGVVLGDDAADAVTFVSARAAGDFASAGWCGGPELHVEPARTEAETAA